MDRFIAPNSVKTASSSCYLKSNMDRFIVRLAVNQDYVKSFKIQYGQIYSASSVKFSAELADLKSNMDRFIADRYAAATDNIAI